MKKNKSIFILSALLILSTSFAIYSKYQEKKLRVQLNKITKTKKSLTELALLIKLRYNLG